MALQVVGLVFLNSFFTHLDRTPLANGNDWHFWLHPIQHVFQSMNFSHIRESIVDYLSIPWFLKYAN